MIDIDELKKAIRRNKCLGMWAAEKLGLNAQEAAAYSDALAVGTLDAENRDVFSKIRKDFDAAGVLQSDEQILQVMNELSLQVSGQTQGAARDTSDAVAVVLARKLTSR